MYVWRRYHVLVKQRSIHGEQVLGFGSNAMH